MKLLMSIFVVIFLIFYFFGNITVNKIQARGMKRLILSVIVGFIFALIIGLPILGIISLF